MMLMWASRLRIFAKLSRREVIAISPVCRRWRDVASCEPVWRHVELVSVAESLGDKELGLLAEKRLKVSCQGLLSSFDSGNVWDGCIVVHLTSCCLCRFHVLLSCIVYTGCTYVGNSHGHQLNLLGPCIGQE